MRLEVSIRLLKLDQNLLLRVFFRWKSIELGRIIGKAAIRSAFILFLSSFNLTTDDTRLLYNSPVLRLYLCAAIYSSNIEFAAPLLIQYKLLKQKNQYK